MSGLRGLLDAIRDPKNGQGLLDMGVSLMGASGPSPVPMSFGQRFAQGYMGSQQMANERAAQALRKQMMEAQIAQMNKPDPAAQRRTFKGADGNEYYEDGTRVLPNVNAPIPPPAPMKPPETRTVTRGSQQVTEEWDATAGKWINVGTAPRWQPPEVEAPKPPPGIDIKDVDSLRKDFKARPAVSAYESTLPILLSARRQKPNPAGDIDLAYSVAKIMDPGSAVKEGEVQMTADAAPMVKQLFARINKEMKNGSGISEKTRKELLDMLNNRVLSYRQQYDQEYRFYSDLAQRRGFVPRDVVGRHAVNAFPQARAAPRASPPGSDGVIDLPPRR